MNRKPKGQLRGKARLRAEIVETTEALHRIGIVSDEDLAETKRLTSSDAGRPKALAMSPDEIVALRKQQGLTLHDMAAFLNVAPSTVSQWERGARRPTGAALKLLQVVKQNGVAALA